MKIRYTFNEFDIHPVDARDFSDRIRAALTSRWPGAEVSICCQLRCSGYAPRPCIYTDFDEPAPADSAEEEAWEIGQRLWGEMVEE